MMTRHQRVALELLAPAPLGLLGFGLIALSREMACGGALTMRSQDFLLIVWCLLVACVVAAIPSLIYSLIMEGAIDGMWEFENKTAGRRALRAYLKRRDSDKNDDEDDEDD